MIRSVDLKAQVKMDDVVHTTLAMGWMLHVRRVASNEVGQVILFSAVLAKLLVPAVHVTPLVGLQYKQV